MGYEINPELKNDIHRNDSGHCPYCGNNLKAHAIPSEDSTPPIPGDFSLCTQCGGFLRFDRDLKLRKLPLDEFDSLESKEKAVILTQYMNLKIMKKLQGKEHELTFDLKKYFKGS